ncbi:hypothetical protein J8628_03175 [Serratia fonticola]|uniref:hypothetical protein n=1 Tax=Serratia fonticola TaxID=47917 RepID=UPI001AEAD53A|nr:hypothetical protein [Serratia fonticola]MBP1015909.1 hypothetical protein [Serratia fonticola]
MTAESWTIVSVVSACASALATFIAATAALFALHTWKKQERKKAYQGYLMALATFEAELNLLPSSFSRANCAQSFSSTDGARPTAIRAFSKCQEAWVGYSIYPYSELQSKAWNDLESVAKSYLYYEGEKSKIYGRITTAKNAKNVSFWQRVNKELDLPFDYRS